MPTIGSSLAQRLFGGVRPPVQPTPQQQAGPSLAMPVANPGSRGQNMRYYLGNLSRLDDGSYSDGVYRYDSNGLSLDRPDAPVGGLPPADESERWSIWRPPSLGGGVPPPGPGVPSGPSPGMGPGVWSGQVPSFGPGMATISPFVSQIAAMIPRPGPDAGLISRLPPEDAAQVPPGETIGYSGAPSLAELLRVAMARGGRGRGFLA